MKNRGIRMSSLLTLSNLAIVLLILSGAVFLFARTYQQQLIGTARTNSLRTVTQVSSPFHGFSAEFSEYRQYNPGEPTRNIDYRLYGRTDRLYVKQFEEETNLRCQIFIDCSRSMLFPLEHHANIDQPNKLTFSAYAAAVLIELLHCQGIQGMDL